MSSRNPDTSTALPNALNRPIRVVLFGDALTFDRTAKEFACRLEMHDDIEVRGVFLHAPRKTAWAIVLDLWKRRGLLAIPMLLLRVLNGASSFWRSPKRIVSNHKLRSFAERIHFVADIHAPAVLNRVASLAPDLGLIYGSPILKPQLFEIPKLGTLGIHHGKIPDYRGKKTTFWAMYNGEKTAGVTIQRVGTSLDAGEIVRQGEVATDNRSLGRVWQDLETLGLDLYIQAILDVKQGTAQYTRRHAGKTKVYRDPTLRDILIFWKKRLVR